MLDEFLKFGAGFDWITPLWAFIQDARYGQPFQINVPYDSGWSGREIITELNEKGIKTWGLMVVGENITFTIRKPQARYTLYWLEKWGVPYIAQMDKLPIGRNAKAYDAAFAADDEELEDEPEGLCAEIGEAEDEIEDEEELQPYPQGLMDYSLRTINITADKLVGRR